jgi:hypothetical protein
MEEEEEECTPFNNKVLKIESLQYNQAENAILPHHYKYSTDELI